MLERLYCPDFSTLLGPEYRNPFEYPKIDTLIWPTLKDIPQDSRGKALLSLTSRDGHPLFYRRGLTINSLVTELKCSDLDGACMQAIDLNEEYGICTENVLSFAQNFPSLIFPIASPRCTPEGVKIFEKNAEKVVAAVLYPTYQALHFSNPSEELLTVLEICKNHALPIKIDLGNMYLPNNDPSKCNPLLLRKFVNANPELTFVFSGIDLTGNGIEVMNTMRYERNAWVEFDPRTFGGTTPEDFFKKAFSVPGFTQYGWSKFLLGSSTPMLESSQVVRGFWNATQDLPFAQQSLLRTWMFRNACRTLNFTHCVPECPSRTIFSGNIEDAAERGEWANQVVVKRSDSEIFVQQDLRLQSFSVTQLLHVQPYVNGAIRTLCQKYPDYRFGEFTLKSPHTTTSLLVNEHEHGNFLQLHYNLAEDTMASAEGKLHTTPALENRADFNYPDHITASTRGQRSITAPILNGKPKIGGRENTYALVTFGPRGISLHLSVKLFKDQS